MKVCLKSFNEDHLRVTFEGGSGKRRSDVLRGSTGGLPGSGRRGPLDSDRGAAGWNARGCLFPLALFPFDVEVSLIVHQNQILYEVRIEPKKMTPVMEIAPFSVLFNIKGEQSLSFCPVDEGTFFRLFNKIWGDN